MEVIYIAKICSLEVVSDKGNLLHGSPAQEVFIKRQGGWDNFYKNMIQDITERVTAKVIPEVINEVFKEQRKEKFKIIEK